MATLFSLFDKTAQKMPEQVALVFSDNKIEYGRCLEAINRLAQGLKDLGIAKGDRVALMLPNVPHFCISYYAILRLGAVVVPINIMYQESDIRYHLTDSTASAIIAWEGFSSEVIPAVRSTSTCKEILLLGNKVPNNTRPLTLLMAKSRPIEGAIPVEADDLAVINYTAGISDEALGAELTHAALLANASTIRDMYHITSEEKLISVLPLFHPLGQTLVMNTSFLVGATVVLMPRFEPNEVVKAIQEHNVTFLAAVPDMYRSLVNTSTETSTPSLKYCLSYGGRLSAELMNEFETKFDTLVLEAYGLTEAGPLVAANRLDRDRKPGSVGLPLVGVEIQIRDEEGNIQKPLESGEIWVKSPSLMRGYFNRPEESAKRLKDGWLFTGDMGYLDEDHYLFIQDRKEDIILKGGFHIFPREVENVLLQHEAVEEVSVIGVPDKVQGWEVKAYVVLKKDHSATAEELIEFCRQTLPVYKTPKYLEIRTILPKSATGRVLKRVLRNESIENRNMAKKSNSINKK